MARDDMFLKIGGIKGNSIDSSHKDEIQVLRWSWGMTGNFDPNTGEAKGRTTVHELEIDKRVDTASTGLMSAMRNNDRTLKATLTVREAGGDSPLEYLKITLEKASVTRISLESAEVSDGPASVERVRLSFQKIRVEYQGQAKSGGSQGTSTFETSVEPGR